MLHVYAEYFIQVLFITILSLGEGCSKSNRMSIVLDNKKKAQRKAFQKRVCAALYMYLHKYIAYFMVFYACIFSCIKGERST